MIIRGKLNKLRETTPVPLVPHESHLKIMWDSTQVL